MRGSWAVGVAVMALSLLAGCSSGSSSAFSGKPPREILKTAGMVMARASSVKITGTLTASLEDRTVQDRIRYVVFSNGDLAGSISDPGGTADVVYIPPRVAPGTPYAVAIYYRANADFYVWQQAALSVARKISGVWIIASGTSGPGSLFSLTGLTDLLLHPAGSLSTGPRRNDRRPGGSARARVDRRASDGDITARVIVDTFDHGDARHVLDRGLGNSVPGGDELGERGDWSGDGSLQQLERWHTTFDAGTGQPNLRVHRSSRQYLVRADQGQGWAHHRSVELHFGIAVTPSPVRRRIFVGPSVRVSLQAI